MGRILISACLPFLLVTSACAHGTAFFLSTPVSPPAEMIWAGYAGLLLLAATATILLRKYLSLPWWRAILGGIIAIAVPAYVFNRYGAWYPSLSTGPEPGLQWGRSPAFWGADWNEIGGLFLWWNSWNFLWILAGIFAVIGIRKRYKLMIVLSSIILSVGIANLVIGQIFDYSPLAGGNFIGGVNAPMYSIIIVLFAVISLHAVHGFIATKKRWPIIIACLAAYLLSIAPYLALGTLSHGWPGGYTHQRCLAHKSHLGNALIQYLLKHDGKLPTGTSLQEIYDQLIPDVDKNWRQTDLICCPIDALYQRNPEVFKWNAEFSGKRIDELRVSPATPLITCRHFDEKKMPSQHVSLYIQNVTDAYAIAQKDGRVEVAPIYPVKKR